MKRAKATLSSSTSKADRLRHSLVILAVALTGCATGGAPSDFVYETTARKQQGVIGTAARDRAAQALLSAGVVQDPEGDLIAALPNAEVNLRRWGLHYFDENWNRYHAVLDADVKTSDGKTKCRLRGPDAVEDAPSFDEITAEGGTLLQAQLEALVQLCASEALNPDRPSDVPPNE